MAKQRNGAETSLLEAVCYVLFFPVILLWYLLKGIGKLLGLLAGKLKGQKSIEDMTGYEYEEYVAEKLRKLGFKNIDVTPKSGDFGADILANTRRGELVCFQCKRYTRPVGPKAVQEVYAAMRHYECDYGVVVSSVGYTEGARTLAEDCGIELWEGI